MSTTTLIAVNVAESSGGLNAHTFLGEDVLNGSTGNTDRRDKLPYRTPSTHRGEVMRRSYGNSVRGAKQVTRSV